MRINVLGVAVDQEGGFLNIKLAPNQEVCFDDNGHSVGASSPDCKMDLYLKKMSKTRGLYEVKIIKGCY